MTAFNIGDRVEYYNPDSSYRGAHRRKGTVTGQGSYGPQIQYDDGDYMLRYPYPENVRHLVPESGPTVLRARADEIEAEANGNDVAIEELFAKIATLSEDAARRRALADQYRAVANDLESS